MGGRFDSTNVIHPLLSIITNIGLDHVQFLGDTYKDIGFEKAGIIKKGTSLITAVDQQDAQEVILSRASELDVPAFFIRARHLILEIMFRFQRAKLLPIIK